MRERYWTLYFVLSVTTSNEARAYTVSSHSTDQRTAPECPSQVELVHVATRPLIIGQMRQTLDQSFHQHHSDIEQLASMQTGRLGSDSQTTNYCTL